MECIKIILAELRPEFDFDDSVDFIEDGYLDSFDIISLINEIENKFQISVDGMDIVPENFTGYDSIAKLIKKSGGEI